MVKPMFQNKGFTLIEMLLVISIILTLSVLSFPFMNTKTIHFDKRRNNKENVYKVSKL